MKSLLRVAAMFLAAGLLYWVSVPYARVHVLGGKDDAGLVGTVWSAQPAGALVFLNSWYVENKLKELPVAVVHIHREWPWNATIEVDLDEPDMVVVEGDNRAAVFMNVPKAYILDRVPDAWTPVDVHGFPTEPSAFAAASVEYAPILLALKLEGTQLNVSSRMVSSKGFQVLLKDGKRLVFGDASNATSKVQRAIAVVNMPQFKSKNVTVDLRFDGQAVIPEKP